MSRGESFRNRFCPREIRSFDSTTCNLFITCNLLSTDRKYVSMLIASVHVHRNTSRALFCSDDTCIRKSGLFVGNKHFGRYATVYGQHTCIRLRELIQKLFSKYEVRYAREPFHKNKYRNVILVTCTARFVENSIEEIALTRTGYCGRIIQTF